MEYSANLEKLKKWMIEKKYTKKQFLDLCDITTNRGNVLYTIGNFKLNEAKQFALLSGMNLYDFIDIFLSDIYPVTQEDFDIVSENDTKQK